MKASLVTLAALVLLVSSASAQRPALVDATPTVFVSGDDGLLVAEIDLQGANPYAVWVLVGVNLVGYFETAGTAQPFVVIVPNNYAAYGRPVTVCRHWLAETHAIELPETRCTAVATMALVDYLPAVLAP